MSLFRQSRHPLVRWWWEMDRLTVQPSCLRRQASQYVLNPIGQIIKKILPLRVFRFNQIDFQSPFPTFDTIFTPFGRLKRFTQFNIYQGVSPVFSGKERPSRNNTFMLRNTFPKIRGHSCVERSCFGAAGHDVDGKLLGIIHYIKLSKYMIEWNTKMPAFAGMTWRKV